MKKYTDMTKIDFYLQGMGSQSKKSVLTSKNKSSQNFKILIKDDVKNSMYLIDA